MLDLDHLPEVLTAAELAHVLRCSEASLAQDRYRNVGVPFVRFGRRVRYLRADVTRFLAANHHVTA